MRPIHCTLPLYKGWAICTTTLGVLLIVLAPSQASDMLSYEELCRKVLEARQRIKTGHFAIDFKARWKRGQTVERFSRKYIMYADTDSLRVDRKMPFVEHYPDGKVQEVMGEKVHALHQRIHYEYNRPSGGLDVFLIDQLPDTDPGSRSYYQKKIATELYDPRQLGLASPSGPLTGLRLDGWHLFRFADDFIVRTEVSAAQYEGLDAWKVVLVGKDGSQETALVVPQWDWISVYCERRSASQLHSRTDYYVQQHRPSGIWYPYKVIYRRWRGDEEEEWEEMNVQIVSINERLDPSVFTPVGFGVPKGTSVRLWPPSSPEVSWIWDGEKIVSQQMLGSVTLGETPRQVKRWPWLWVFLAVACALTAAGICLYWWHRRAAHAH